jgi:hypothetical protein
MTLRRALHISRSTIILFFLVIQNNEENFKLLFQLFSPDFQCLVFNETNAWNENTYANASLTSAAKNQRSRSPKRAALALF